MDNFVVEILVFCFCFLFWKWLKTSSKHTNASSQTYFRFCFVLGDWKQKQFPKQFADNFSGKSG